MDISFDPDKDAANRRKHGLALADAVCFGLDDALVIRDDRHDYGEARFRAFGRVDGEPRVLVFTYAGAAVRLISYRRAHEKEFRRYGL